MCVSLVSQPCRHRQSAVAAELDTNARPASAYQDSIDLLFFQFALRSWGAVLLLLWLRSHPFARRQCP